MEQKSRDRQKEEDRKLAKMREEDEQLKKSSIYRAVMFLGKRTWVGEKWHRQWRK